jgi:threonine synthase
LFQVKDPISKGVISARPKGIWRWSELLPVMSDNNQITLGEGDTSLIPLKNIGSQLGADRLFLKNEAGNPTASFKARGLCVALAKAIELGLDTFALPTAGNAGGAFAAYAARAGVNAHIYMPKSSLQSNRSEVIDFGAHLHLVDGTIQQATRLAMEECRKNDWFNLATFREPYRVEGKKTMGFELAEQFEWVLPDWIVYPSGGGTGLVGMWKAFNELAEMGWITPKQPKFAVIQASGCAPIVKAFRENQSKIKDWPTPNTFATGLNVPSVYAGDIVLRILHETQSIAMDVSEEEILSSQALLGKSEGILASPEGAASLAGFEKLLKLDMIKHHEIVVLFNTASGLKYF